MSAFCLHFKMQGVFTGREDFLDCVTGREDSQFCAEPGRQQYCIAINMSLLNKVVGSQKAEVRDAGELQSMRTIDRVSVYCSFYKRPSLREMQK